jgi:hypothetical protein
MLIQSYGLFWRQDEVDWNPGRGKRNAFRLLGRRGANAGTLKVADFRFQQGIYILYGNYGPYYVGLTRAQGLGKRLKDHLTDGHEKYWDRFSWFGFGAVLKADAQTGISEIRDMPQVQLGEPTTAIADLEALLIKAMGLSNIKNMKFNRAKEWTQIAKRDVSHYTAKVAK